MQIWTRRVYDDIGEADGYRVLVDRVWPRGVRKDDLQLDEWCKDVAPSTELRKWFGHDRDKFEEFAKRYRDELSDGQAAEAVAHLREVAENGRVTLLFSAKDVECNQAVVLRSVIAGE